MRKFFTYQVPCADELNGQLYSAPVLAMETDTPEILLTQSDDGTCRYRLTHKQSGALITSGKFGMTDDVFGLLEVAWELGKVTDWCRHAEDLCATADVCAEVRRVLSEASIEWVGVPTSEVLRKASLRAVGRE